MEDATGTRWPHETRTLRYRGCEVTLLAIGDGTAFTVGYTIMRPSPQAAFSAFLKDSFLEPQAALDDAETQARKFVDYLLDELPGTRQPRAET